jgi:hypothetical protein
VVVLVVTSAMGSAPDRLCIIARSDLLFARV